jgi:hypothetical protein
MTCLAKVAINSWSNNYPPVAGLCAVRERTLAYWNMVHGASMSLTAEQLGLPIAVVRQFFATGRSICAQDAIRREQTIEFGSGGSLTDDIESGEHIWCEWNDDGRQYCLVWLGVVKRGTPAHLLLRPSISSDTSMLPGVTYNLLGGLVLPVTSFDGGHHRPEEALPYQVPQVLAPRFIVLFHETFNYL